eukprot:CAMPEP_0113455582 /NCGR_PEP_ID=MMETSP0014_2-20120614/8449_1 /TAXON_ID=2857 /ORGANISM="Nitzschia sp." /LENGTH=290 /DNA_ID=CAMNT_0000347015 /DNA_START=75 /DNA_END=947 /DNA_ORIENTATION=- /assembly_acc=CAM_ASM_000159
MTVQQLTLIVSLLSSSISSSAAFAPQANVMLPQQPQPQPQPQQQHYHATRLMMSPATGTTTSTNPTMRPMTEEQAQYILNKARECAFMDGSLVDDLIEHGGHIEHSANPLDDIIAASDVAAVATDNNNSDSAQLQQPSSLNVHFTIDDARYLLREMIHIQSNCVTGQVVGKEFCDDQDTAAEIVANLRYKIDKYERRLAKRQKGSDSSVPLVATELSLGALVLVVAVFWTTLDMSGGGGGGLSGGPDGVDMMAATSSSSSATPSLQLNNFNDWLGVFQERYLGAKDAIVS